MTNEEDCSALALGNVFHLTYRFLLELRIAHRKHFIHHQDLRLQERSDSEPKPHSHTGGITFDRGVNIAFTAGEINDLVQLGLDLITGHAEDGAVHEDILTSGHLAMEACADFEQGANSTMGSYRTRGRTGDAAQEFEQCRFAGAVLADDADDVALLDLEVDVAQSPDVF